MTEQSRVSVVDQQLSSLNNIVLIDYKHPNTQLIGQKSKKQIEQWLQAEARHLINKKQREADKQQRLRQLQAQYQRQREMKHRKIDKKLASSENNRKKNVESIQKKFINLSKRNTTVLQKFNHDREQQMDKRLEERKTFEIDSRRPSSKMSSSSRASGITRYRLLNKSTQMEEEIEKQIVEISHKIEKANHKKQEKESQLLNKIHQHNTKDIQLHQNKANEQLSNQISTFTRKISQKIDIASRNKKKIDISLEERLSNREKVYSERLKMYQDNLRNIQNQKVEKLESLNKKFEQNHMSNKSWHNERDDVYHQRFLCNMEVLEQQKLSRAERILQKHQQITAKNKLYRQRKDSLFKAIKHRPVHI